MSKRAFTQISAIAFIRESNRIEGLLHDPTNEEILAFLKLMASPVLTVAGLCEYVEVVAGQKLRTERHMNVTVGNHTPPGGGMNILYSLEQILFEINTNPAAITPYKAHCRYETLHPFLDGNGRSGRAVWAWHSIRRNEYAFMHLGFLHVFYYQSLNACDERN